MLSFAGLDALEPGVAGGHVDEERAVYLGGRFRSKGEPGFHAALPHLEGCGDKQGIERDAVCRHASQVRQALPIHSDGNMPWHQIDAVE